ncbi:scoloptoxin SSD14-like [Lytechinus variegatus]|uniref:scoloptoxin SSD14-like n=1 Tax=Lytechinus variegatus TaxID=7654 RepID=UPI001BB102B1|nr:scoloptoxin SSD14-like [Lytechinus variegatus]
MNSVIKSLKERKTWELCLAFFLTLLLVFAVVACFVFPLVLNLGDKDHDVTPTSAADMGYRFDDGAVAADAEICSQVGRDILQDGGSAVDAAIAAMLCIGVVHPSSAGIGGGFFMTVYERESGTTRVIDGRERAPFAANETMFVEHPELSLAGALSIAVPGELHGYKQAHDLYGVLPWNQLFRPAIAIAEEGYLIDKTMAADIVNNEDYIRSDVGLSSLFLEDDGNLKEEGDMVLNPLLAATMRRLATEGVDIFYTGDIAQTLVDETQDIGGIITLADMSSYESLVKQPLHVNLFDGLTAFTAPPPSSGVVAEMIMNIMDEYSFTSDDISTLEGETLMYHRFIEATKFAFAKRAQLGDTEYEPVQDLISNMTSEDLASLIRQTIDDVRVTYDNVTQYDAPFVNTFDEGTSHLSVIAPNGDAVAMTSTVNNGFGSKFMSPTTGVVLNNQMDSFSTPGLRNSDGIAPSSPNFIKPGKRPMSSMSPTILLAENGDVRLALGASGSSRMITSISLVSLRTQRFEEDLRDVINQRRIHHQLSPNYIQYEDGFSEEIMSGLENKDHELYLQTRYAVVQAILRDRDGSLFAFSDPRKGGVAAGF